MTVEELIRFMKRYQGIYSMPQSEVELIGIESKVNSVGLLIGLNSDGDVIIYLDFESDVIVDSVALSQALLVPQEPMQ